ncbi:hypothetical protein [Helicobacter trogontum]|uniref:hypothetical protein n=2 Tax=Helicobacter trogontum TaxID=50960 RepID=UPI002A9189DB|nr:hypothetical protein [Helicobacter trogontum]MDY5185080.1 hypothetical protein [Helicobacter trogontum]
MREDKYVQNTISIEKIHNIKPTQEIKEIIEKFLKNAKDKNLALHIIAPTDFIAERLYQEFDSYMDTSKIKTLCFYSIKLDNLLSDIYKQQRQRNKSKLNIQYINEDSNNPLEIFINKVANEAQKIRNNQQKEEKQTHIVHNIASVLATAPIQVGSGSMGDLDNINSVRENQEKLRRHSFFEDIELLEYSNAYIPKEPTLNFYDIKDADSIGIQYIKEFFIDIVERVTSYYEAYIGDKQLRDKKLEDLKTKLMHTRNEILTNLSNTKQNKADDETRTALLIALKIGIAIISVCLSLGSGSLFVFLALSLGTASTIREMYDISEELSTLGNNRYYRAVAVPILTAFFKDISEVLAVCLVESHIFMLLDSDGNFIDLSGLEADFLIKEKSFNLTPELNQIIQGKYYGNMQDIIDILINQKSFTLHEDNEYSSMCISPLHTDSNTKSPAYNLFNKLTKSYTNFIYMAHPAFTSKRLATTIKEENTTKSNRNYITFTPPPSKQRAGSMEKAIRKMGVHIQGRPNPPKLTNNNPTQDYSSYTHDDMDSNDLFLYLSPFVKINQTKKGEYKDNKALSYDDKQHIQSLMIQEQNIKFIKELRQTFIKEHIGYYKFLFDSVKFEVYTASNDIGFGREEYSYTPENIFLKALLLYFLEQDGAEIKKGYVMSKVYAEAQGAETMLQGKKTTFLVQYNQNQAIPIDLIDLKDQIKEAMKQYKENANNDYKIVLGNFFGNITLHPFSNDTNTLSLSSISHHIKEQYIGFKHKQLDEALPLIMQSIGENFLTTLLPTTKIFFADTESKKLEALSILFITFSFALYFTKNDNKFTLSLSSAAIGTDLPNIIKNATLETLENALNNKKDSIRISQNVKKNTQINNLLKQIKVQEITQVPTIKLDRAGNKLVVIQKGNSIQISIIDNNNNPIKQPQHITIQADNTQMSREITKAIGKQALKASSQAFIIALADATLTHIISSLFKTDSKILLERYKSLEYKLQSLHHAPLIMDSDTFFTYPMPIHSRMIIYNFAYGLFGGSLSTGGLEIAPNIFLYAALQKLTTTGKITNQSAFTRHIIIKQILAFIIPDELRGGMEDRDFYKTLLTKELSLNTLKSEYRLDTNNIRLRNNGQDINEIIQSYNLSQSQCEKQKINFKSNANVIVDSYNFCIDYLTDEISGIHKTTHTRNFMEALRNIAKNNILAIYEGVSDTNRVKQPKIFGRIATTIIQQDGLYLG